MLHLTHCHRVGIVIGVGIGLGVCVGVSVGIGNGVGDGVGVVVGGAHPSYDWKDGDESGGRG